MEPWRKNLARLIDREGPKAFQDRLGVTAPTISRWRKGSRWPDPGMVLRICSEFRLTPNELYGVDVAGGVSEPAAEYGALRAPTNAEVVALALHLRQAQTLVEPYLTDDDRKSLETAAAKLARRAAGRKSSTRAGGR